MSQKKLSLPNVTLAAMTSVNIYETVCALKYSMRGIDFGEVVLITDKKPFYLPRDITYKHTDIIDEIDKFNYKMVYELTDYIDTDYVLLVHYDGFVVNPEMWQDEFLEYDYIGSPWPLPDNDYMYRDSEGNICRVGNSVSIRSKKLMDYPKEHNLKWEKVWDGNYNEDAFLCCVHKNEMEEAGIKFAPIGIAKYFGHEHDIPEIQDVEYPFVFHKWWGRNKQYPMFMSPYKRICKVTLPIRNVLGIHKK